MARKSASKAKKKPVDIQFLRRQVRELNKIIDDNDVSIAFFAQFYDKYFELGHRCVKLEDEAKAAQDRFLRERRFREGFQALASKELKELRLKFELEQAAHAATGE